MRIRCHIDSVLVEGTSAGPHQALALREAISRELGSRLSAPQKFESLQQRKVTAGLPAMIGSTPERTGTDIGAAIYGSLQLHAE
jgi:hypothetical protein